MIAFTNHALDHLLCNVLDAGITTKIARLGSRHSAHERILPYSLEALERQPGRSLHRWDIHETREELKEVAEEFSSVTATLNGTAVDPSALIIWLKVNHPEHHHRLHNPPWWVQTVRRTESEGWTTVGDKTRDESVSTDYGFWVKGIDLDFIDPPVVATQPNLDAPLSKTQHNRFSVFDTTKEESSTSSQRRPYHYDLVEWFIKHGFNKIPPVPQGDRPLDVLLCNDDVWNMSRCERSTLRKHWESGTRADSHQSNVAIFDDLRQKHAKLQSDLDAFNNEVTIVPLTPLHSWLTSVADPVKFIAGIGYHRLYYHWCSKIDRTLEGKQNLSKYWVPCLKVFQNLRPAVLLVEEAGQVLEAHILGSLVPSIEHLIMIGDPLQLRPTINNFCECSQSVMVSC